MPNFFPGAVVNPGADTKVSFELQMIRINELKGMCQGIHIMAMGWESRIPAMLDAAGL